MKKILFFGILVGVFFCFCERVSAEDVYTRFYAESNEECPTCTTICQCTGYDKNTPNNVYIKNFFTKTTHQFSACNIYNRQNVQGYVDVDLEKSICQYRSDCNVSSGGDFVISCELTSVENDYCCCRDVGANVSGNKKECKKVRGKNLSCNSEIFDGSFSGSMVSEPGYYGFVIDSTDDCSTYAKTTQKYTGSDSSITSDTLKLEAKNTLNPMNFKTGTAGVQQLMSKAVSALTFAMGSLLLLFYVYAGILWMTAAGNQERIGQAKKIVVWSTLGVVVILSSYLIVQAVFNFAG